MVQSVARPLTLREDTSNGTISVFRAGDAKPLVTQNAGAEFRPYLHPLLAPDGKGVLTEFSPSHHKHQTGIYWGLTRLNGRDYFHNPGKGYWRRVSSQPVIREGEEVKWTTAYELLNDAGQPIMLETQLWAMRDKGDRYLLDLEWTGEALVDLTVSKYEYGGLFVRMPWREGVEGSVINSARQRNDRANNEGAVWVDVGGRVEGGDDVEHIAETG